MKKASKMILALGLLALAQGAFAASEQIQFSNISGAKVSFADTGTGVDFTFPPSGSQSASDFMVTSIGGFTIGGDLLSGLKGVITGTYNYLTSAIVTNGTSQKAAVTGTGSFVIHDGLGNDFTSTLTWVDIKTDGTGGTINTLGTVNLSTLSYGGTNAQLLELAANPNGIVVTTFQFIPAMSLSDIAANCPAGAPCTNSFSGTLAAVPEPGFYGTLALGFAGLVFAVQVRRRKVA